MNKHKLIKTIVILLTTTELTLVACGLVMLLNILFGDIGGSLIALSVCLIITAINIYKTL